jgi:hypothetical protein
MVAGMKRRIEVRIRRFNPQQIAMRTSIAPSAVRIIRLLAHAQRNTEGISESRPYPAQDILDEDGVLLAFDLAGLQHKVSISGIESQRRPAHDFTGIHPVTADF